MVFRGPCPAEELERAAPKIVLYRVVHFQVREETFSATKRSGSCPKFSDRSTHFAPPKKIVIVSLGESLAAEDDQLMRSRP